MVFLKATKDHTSFVHRVKLKCLTSVEHLAVHGGTGLGGVGVGEVNVGPDSAVVQGFHGTEIVRHLGLGQLHVALHQLAKGVQLRGRDAC